MHFTSIVASAILLVAEADIISAKAILHLPNALRRRNPFDEMDQVADRIMRREPQSSSVLSVAEPNAATNQTIATACVNALDQLTKVDNDAGFSACYNIIQYDPQQGAFEADLRLYQMFQPSGSFKGIAVNDIMIGLTYPASTMFQSLTKRRKRDVVKREANANTTEVQQYSLFGTFEKNLDLSLLNDTQIMSLMLPQITLNAVDPSQTPINANITSADGAWFVVGQFKDEYKDTLVTSAAATAAIAAAAPFVLPGTHLGIFPTGLIVTCAWTVLFFLAFGLGTLGRIQYRDLYRKRKAARAGRTGKRI